MADLSDNAAFSSAQRSYDNRDDAEYLRALGYEDGEMPGEESDAPEEQRDD